MNSGVDYPPYQMGNCKLLPCSAMYTISSSSTRAYIGLAHLQRVDKRSEVAQYYYISLMKLIGG